MKYVSFMFKQKLNILNITKATMLKQRSITIKIPREDDPKKLEQKKVTSKLNMSVLDLISQKTGGKSYVIDSSSNQVESFMAAAVAATRKPTVAMVKTGDARNFWWDLLAIPSFLIVLFILIRFFKS